jgi:hypothetical protein
MPVFPFVLLFPELFEILHAVAVRSSAPKLLPVWR